MKEQKAVRISGEIHLLVQRVDGFRELGEWLNESLRGGLLPLSIAATLTLVRERLQLLNRAARSTVNPHLLWRPENDAVPQNKDDDEGDIFIHQWSDRETIRRLRKDLKMAKRRLQKAKCK